MPDVIKVDGQVVAKTDFRQPEPHLRLQIQQEGLVPVGDPWPVAGEIFWMYHKILSYASTSKALSKDYEELWA